jgi:hypothetical protein|tara:strand:- start:1093 stop:1293 length:201 start_codon:yes stop_codon:yes gene_type:complete
MGTITPRLEIFNGFKVGVALEHRIQMVGIKENDEGFEQGFQPALFKGLYICIACFELSFTKTFLMK